MSESASLLDRLDPRKTAWYNRDEWYKNKQFKCHEVVEEHDCPAWDIRLLKVEEYKHKDSCQVRYRIKCEDNMVRDKDLTFFEDPREQKLKWYSPIVGDSESEPLSWYNIYNGPLYK